MWITSRADNTKRDPSAPRRPAALGHTELLGERRSHLPFRCCSQLPAPRSEHRDADYVTAAV